MCKAGRALGVFHNNSTAPSETKTVYDDLQDLHEYTLIIAKVKPDLAPNMKRSFNKSSQRSIILRNRSPSRAMVRCAPTSSSCRETAWR